MTEQPGQKSRVFLGQEYQELAKRRDSYAACATEMILEGLWDTAAVFARQYKDAQDQIAELLGLSSTTSPSKPTPRSPQP